MGKYFDTISSPRKFVAVKSKGQYFKDSYGYGFVQKSGLEKSALSIVVSKKVSKFAVVRNRVKRLFRAAFTDILRKLKETNVGLVYIFKGTKIPTYKEVLYSLNRIIN